MHSYDEHLIKKQNGKLNEMNANMEQSTTKQKNITVESQKGIHEKYVSRTIQHNIFVMQILLIMTYSERYTMVKCSVFGKNFYILHIELLFVS